MHQILHIYGPIAIYSYGLAIAIGLLAFTFLIKKSPQFSALKLEPVYSEALLVSIIGALIGGRLVFMLSHPQEIGSVFDFFAVWRGGYSVLGNVFGVLVSLPLFLWIHKIPILPTLDLAAIYIPLLQSISRLGCLAAGCCYGIPSNVPWAISYHDQQVVAPLCVSLHPSQLYSSLALFGIFLFMYFYLQKKRLAPGIVACVYLMLSSLERFGVDFWRGDRVFTIYCSQLSMHQLISLAIFVAALLGAILLHHFSRRSYEHI